MKNLLKYLLIVIFFTQPALSQVKTFKFKNEKDAKTYRLLEEALTKGYEIDSTGKIYITGTVNKYLTMPEIWDLMQSIRKTPYLRQRPKKAYTTYKQLHSTCRKDTIKSLSFSGDSIKRFPFFKMTGCKNLERIELINCEIDKLPWWLNWKLFGLNNLKSLKIYNYDKDDPFRFKKNTNLEKLVYRYSVFSPVPSGLKKIQNLREVDLVQNDIILEKNLQLNKLKKLQEVNVSKNKIRIHQLVSDTSYSIKKLIISHNSLSSVPDEIAYFKKLQDLQLAENDIRSDSISQKLASLEQLRNLSFYKNKLSYLPPILFSFPDLVELDLYYNSIEVVPEAIGQLKNLQLLYLANNLIYYLPESIGELHNLKELYIHHNRISTLPESMCNLSELTDFHIHENYFNSFPSCILSFSKLQDLDISFNEITKIPAGITNLKNLKLFWMRGIMLEASSKEEAVSMKQTLETLQNSGVKVSIEAD